MPTETLTPPRPAVRSAPVDPDQPTSKRLPAALLLLLLSALGFAIYRMIEHILAVPVGENQDVRFVFRRLEESVRPFGTDIEARYFWLPILGVILTLGIGYAVWMYVRDSRAVGGAWATFLGVTRCSVYVLLASVFLLPALQTWDKAESFSRVLVLPDLSGSMHLSDVVGADGAPGPSRLDELGSLFTRNDSELFRRLQKNNPVVVYAFGGAFDPEARELKRGEDAPTWDKGDFEAWLRLDLKQWVLDGLSEQGRAVIRSDRKFASATPGEGDQWLFDWFRGGGNPEVLSRLDEADRHKLAEKGKHLQDRLELRRQILSGTDYAEAVLAALTQQSGQPVAGIIIVGDGQNTTGSDSLMAEVRRRAAAARIPIIAIGIGKIVERKAIRIADLSAPSRTPPEDKFVVRVDVLGEGLADQPFSGFLDIGKAGQPRPLLSIPFEGKFRTGGPVPRGQVTIVIDPEKAVSGPLRRLEKNSKTGEQRWEFIPGEYQLNVRILRAKGEIFKDKEHTNDIPVTVTIAKQELRVLLIGSGPSKDFQFTRNLFMNEERKGRAALSVYQQVTVKPQGPRTLDVPAERLLKRFPSRLHFETGAKEDKDKFDNLASYDVIIAFDPDWLRIHQESPGSLIRLKSWVDHRGGGLIYVAGMNTHRLTEKEHEADFKPLTDILPVVVEDDRKIDILLRPAGKALPLIFPSAGAGDADFLKLDDGSPHPLAGWSEFFYGKPHNQVDRKKDPVRKGFFRCYPAKKVKEGGAYELATFPGSMLKDDYSKDEPFIVTGPYGKGRVVYLGNEMWQLRGARHGEHYYERFWTKLARHLGRKRDSARGILVMGRRFVADGDLHVGAQLFDRDLKFLPPTAEVTARMFRKDGDQERLVMSRRLQAKQEGIWAGEFAYKFRAPAEGKYRLRLEVPGSDVELSQEFFVKASNPELDKTRPDFEKLAALASPISDLRVTDPARINHLKSILAGADDPRLFFEPGTAMLIPDYLTSERRTLVHPGKIEDLWSDGVTIGTWDGAPVVLSTVLLLVVGLLSLEWLTRKLLRLA
jgi:uncharacterized membrane protein